MFNYSYLKKIVFNRIEYKKIYTFYKLFIKLLVEILQNIIPTYSRYNEFFQTI